MGEKGLRQLPRQGHDQGVGRADLESSLLALAGGIGGLYLSYYAGTAGGASVALAIVAIYLLSLPAGRLRATRRPLPGEATIV